MIQELPILPTATALLFPNVARSLALDDRATIAAASAAFASSDRRLVVVAARSDAVTERPSGDRGALYGVGTYAAITRLVPRAAGIEVIVQGLERAAIERTRDGPRFRAATIRTMPLSAPAAHRTGVLLERRVVQLAARLLERRPEVTVDLRDLTERVRGTARIYVITALLGLGVAKEQAVLEAASGDEALGRLHAYLAFELEVGEARARRPRRAHRPAS